MAGRTLEGLFAQQAAASARAVGEIADSVARCRQRRRPQRSYPRRSLQPDRQWRPAKKPATPNAV